MPFIPQTSGGAVAGANAYITVAQFSAYHADRGNDVSAYSPTQVEQAIVRSTDYIDATFEFQGLRSFDGQTLEWPRTGVYRRPELDLVDDQGVPDFVVKATAELALAALAADLDPNVTSESKFVTSESKRAGNLALSRTFDSRRGGPVWRKANKYLAPYLAAQELLRA